MPIMPCCVTGRSATWMFVLSGPRPARDPGRIAVPMRAPIAVPIVCRMPVGGRIAVPGGPISPPSGPRPPPRTFVPMRSIVAHAARGGEDVERERCAARSGGCDAHGRASVRRPPPCSFESVESTVVSLKMLVLSRGPCNAMHRALS